MKKLYKYLIYFTAFLLLFIFFLKLYVFKEIINILIISFILTFILKPLMNILMERGFNKKFAAIIIILLLVICIIALFVCIIPAVFKERFNIQSSIFDIESYTVDLERKLKVINNKIINDLTNNAYKKINLLTGEIFNKLLEFILKLGDNLITFLVVPIVVYYFLVDGNYIKDKILSIFSCKSRKIINNIFDDMEKILKNYFIGQLILCIIIGGLTFVLLFFLKIRFPVLLSVFNGVLNIIPYFGPVLGMVPIFFIALLNSKLTALYSLMGLLLIQQLEGNILAPKITGDSVNMHPLTVILLLLIGSKIGGFAGMILAVPFIVILKIVYDNLNYYLF